MTAPVLVDDEAAVDRIFELWFTDRIDTKEIASRLMLREFYVYNVLKSKDDHFADMRAEDNR